MRRLSLKYPPRLAALNRTKHTYFIKSKHGKDLKRVSWTCEKCGTSGLTAKEKEMDHIIPIADEHGYTDILTFVDSLFCSEENWMTLCKPCHDKKTAIENQNRFDARNKK